MRASKTNFTERLGNLPQLEVCNGCTQCSLRCAAGTRASREEWEAIRSFVARMAPEERAAFIQKLDQSKQRALGDGITITLCRFLDMTTQLCSIYPVRPLVCRLMGHVEWLPCPIGKVPNSLQREQALAILEEYSHTQRRSLEEWEQIAPLLVPCTDDT